MHIPVTDAAAVNDHRMIEQRAVSVRCRLELVEEIRKLGDVEPVDRPDLRLLGDVAPVVREVVMAVGNADRRIASVASVVAEDERRDSALVGLEGENQKIAHHAQVLFDIGGDSQRSWVDRSTQIDSRPGSADPLLDLANAGEVFIQLATVRGPQVLREASGIFGDEVEDALLAPIAAGAGLLRLHSRSGRRRAGRTPTGD